MHRNVGVNEMKTVSKLAKLSIGVTLVAWVLFLAISLVPMSEGGLPAVASLFMDTVFTVIAAADVFGTIALDRQKPGCLSAGYFIGWGLPIVLMTVSAVFGIVRTILKSHEDLGPDKTADHIIGIIFGVLVTTAIPVAKIFFGLFLRKRSDGIQTPQPSDTSPPHSPSATGADGR